MGMTDILSLLGGLALFLYGMHMMSNGLEAAAGNRMKSILEKLTSNRIKGVLDTRRWMFAFVLCAPVAGHAFPLFYPKRGGKAIAVSFGVLLGLLPRYRPVLLLIFFYLLFSFLIVVKPHLYRSILTFTLFSLTGLFYFHDAVISMGTFFISCVVIIRHLVHHQKEPFSIRFLQRS